MKSIATSLLVLLASTLTVSAWELQTDKDRFAGTRTTRCQTLKEQKSNYFIWNRDFVPSSSSDSRESQSPCCIHMYADTLCKGRDMQRVCGTKAGFATIDIAAFEVRGCPRMDKD
jgi:hypothetical protein